MVAFVQVPFEGVTQVIKHPFGLVQSRELEVVLFVVLSIGLNKNDSVSYRSVFHDRWVATYFWVSGFHFEVAKNFIIVLNGSPPTNC